MFFTVKVADFNEFVLLAVFVVSQKVFDTIQVVLVNVRNIIEKSRLRIGLLDKNRNDFVIYTVFILGINASDDFAHHLRARVDRIVAYNNNIEWIAIPR